MAKTEVYSWRVSPRTKAALEHEARRTGRSLGALLEEIADQWLEAGRAADGAGLEAQARLHTAAARAIGAIAGGDPLRSTRARALVRRRLARRRAS